MPYQPPKSPIAKEAAQRAAILKAPSPLRPASAKTPDRVKSMSSVFSSVHGEDSVPEAADKFTAVSNELRELKAMYRKVVEAHRALRADYKESEDKRYEAEQRAEAAERELAVHNLAPPLPFASDGVSAVQRGVATCHTSASSTDLHGVGPAIESIQPTHQSEDVKQAALETDALWKALADTVESSVLLMLRKCDAEAQAVAQVDQERHRRAALWDSLQEAVDAATFDAIARSVNCSKGPQPALPVSVARRLFEASDGGKAGEGTPRASRSNEGTPRPVRSTSRAPPLPSAPGAGQRRLSMPSIGTTCATPGKARRESTGGCKNMHADLHAHEMAATPTRTFPGGVIVATPQSASVRDRVRALETSGRKN